MHGILGWHMASVLCLACSVQLASAQQQLIELRIYHFGHADKAAQFDAMAVKVALPALHNLNITPVGVFAQQEPDDAADVLRIVVLPYPSATVFAEAADHWGEIEGFWENASDYLHQDKSDPAFTRIESSLLKGFEGMPRLRMPGSATVQPRLFELRTYESYSDLKGKLKVRMFNQGELDLFNEVGLSAVFFGEALIASNAPQLTYMVVHDDESAMDAAWKRFIDHPKWKEMKDLPEYQDTVSKITKYLLVPTDYSDIR